MVIFRKDLIREKKQCFSSWAVLTMYIYQVDEFSCCLPRHIRSRYYVGLEPNIWAPLNLEWLLLKMTCFSEMPWDPSPLGEYCLICVLITILTIGGGGFKDVHLSLWEMIQLNSIISVLHHIYIPHVYIYIHILYIEWLKKRTPSKHTHPSLSTGKSLAFKLTGDFTAPPAWIFWSTGPMVNPWWCSACHTCCVPMAKVGGWGSLNEELYATVVLSWNFVGIWCVCKKKYDKMYILNVFRCMVYLTTFGLNVW